MYLTCITLNSLCNYHIEWLILFTSQNSAFTPIFCITDLEVLNISGNSPSFSPHLEVIKVYFHWKSMHQGFSPLPKVEELMGLGQLFSLFRTKVVVPITVHTTISKTVLSSLSPPISWSGSVSKTSWPIDFTESVKR